MSKGYTDEATTIWATRQGKRPLSRPVCGYSGTDCPKAFWDQYSVYVLVGGAILLFLSLAAILFFVYVLRREPAREAKDSLVGPCEAGYDRCVFVCGGCDGWNRMEDKKQKDEP
ncbi:hypothetical protein RB195_003338 [Necator americanus]|uniref:Uncharacterized protein n=1 Tax=Necator americanus TaxID=51031 RepID=A0ABR1DNF5_NECAM